MKPRPIAAKGLLNLRQNRQGTKSCRLCSGAEVQFRRVTWPARVAALTAADVAAEVERQSGRPVIIEAAILQRVLETHVRAQLDALADLRVSLA